MTITQRIISILQKLNYKEEEIKIIMMLMATYLTEEQQLQLLQKMKGKTSKPENLGKKIREQEIDKI